MSQLHRPMLIIGFNACCSFWDFICPWKATTTVEFNLREWYGCACSSVPLAHCASISHYGYRPRRLHLHSCHCQLAQHPCICLYNSVPCLHCRHPERI